MTDEPKQRLLDLIDSLEDALAAHGAELHVTASMEVLGRLAALAADYAHRLQDKIERLN